MLDLVISGGQTGADQAALRAARSAGIPTGGTAPLGWLTEDGQAPWLADYGLVECDIAGYPARTEANARDALLTVWFGSADSPGYWSTRRAAEKHYRAFWDVAAREWSERPGELARNIRLLGYRVINVAGNRESKNPGIGGMVESYLDEVFRLMQEADRVG